MTPQDWMWLVFEAVAILTAVMGFVWKAVKQPLDYELRDIKGKLTVGLKGQGERMGKLESDCAAQERSIEELRRMDQQHSFEIAAAQRDQARIEGMQEKIEHILDTQTKNTTSIQIELGKIETKLDIFAELRDIMSLILESRKNEKRS